MAFAVGWDDGRDVEPYNLAPMHIIVKTRGLVVLELDALSALRTNCHTRQASLMEVCKVNLHLPLISIPSRGQSGGRFIGIGFGDFACIPFAMSSEP